jgi:transposase-like protein
MSEISKRHVLISCVAIDKRLGAFLSLRLEGARPYLWINATSVKAREGSRIVPWTAIKFIS